MPTKKSARTATTKPAAPSKTAFPFAQYVSILGVHLVLVAFTALYLPQTTSNLFAPRGTDRPRSTFVDALTANPISTLCWVSLGLVPLQVWWASWMRHWSFQQTSKGSEADMKLERVKFDSLRFAKLWDATVFTSFVTLATYVVVVVFGAPLATHVAETALLSFVIAILTVFTPAFILGRPSWSSDTSATVTKFTWTRLFAELSPRNAIEFAMVYPTVGTFFGAWLGAFPIALDWDRPWQAWPLTPLFGSLGGYFVGALVGFALNTTKWLATEHLRSQPSESKSN